MLWREIILLDFSAFFLKILEENHLGKLQAPDPSFKLLMFNTWIGGRNLNVKYSSKFSLILVLISAISKSRNPEETD